ncbi:MAG: RNA polymerase sigma factor [Phycisphaerae bacterium]
MKTPDDLVSVIRRAQGGEADAFDALVDSYASRLYGFLYRLTGCRDDAEDLVQEVFVRVVRMIGRYQHDGRFDAWIFRIATNLARDRVRRVNRAPSASSLDAGDDPAERERVLTRPRGAAPADRAPGDALELAEDVDRLQQAIATLNAAEREVIMLRHYAGMSFADIAAMMGTPLGTALARAHRALGKLREQMDGNP